MWQSARASWAFVQSILKCSARVCRFALRFDGIKFCFCRDFHIHIVSSDSLWKIGVVSPCWKSAPRKALSNPMLCPTIGVSCKEFFLMNVLI